MQGSHRHLRILTVPLACPIHRESKDVPKASCLWVLCLNHLSPRACDMLRALGYLTVLRGGSVPSQPSQLDSKSVGNTSFSHWFNPLITQAHMSHRNHYWCQNGTFSPPVAMCPSRGMGERNILFFCWSRQMLYLSLELQAGLKTVWSARLSWQYHQWHGLPQSALTLLSKTDITSSSGLQVLYLVPTLVVAGLGLPHCSMRYLFLLYNFHCKLLFSCPPENALCFFFLPF